jgi:hypothetical protein
MKDTEVRAFDLPGRPDPGMDDATFRRMLEALRRRKAELDARHAAQAEGKEPR